MTRIPLALALLFAAALLILEEKKELASGTMLPHSGWALVLIVALVAAAIYLLYKAIFGRKSN